MKIEKRGYITTAYSSLGDNANVCMILHNIKPKEMRSILNKTGTNKRIKVTLELEPPVLDEAEKKYLSNIISRVKYIKKIKTHTNTYQVIICLDRYNNDYQEIILLPEFYENTMYKDMKLRKEYTSDDLNL